MKIKTQFEEVMTPDGSMSVFTAYNDDERKHPAVIVLQEAFGVNPHIRNVCVRFAEEGFFAIAPEVYHREGRRIEIDYADRTKIMPLLQSLTAEKLIIDLENTIEFIKGHTAADSSFVGCIGFCIGGYISMLTASAFNIDSAISFYGGGMVHQRMGFKLGPILNDFSKIQAPVLLIYGADDKGIPLDDVKAVETKLRSEGKKFEIQIYENSDHGFFCDQRPVYNLKTAQMAWDKSLQFFQSTIKNKSKIF